MFRRTRQHMASSREVDQDIRGAARGPAGRVAHGPARFLPHLCRGAGPDAFSYFWLSRIRGRFTGRGFAPNVTCRASLWIELRSFEFRGTCGKPGACTLTRPICRKAGPPLRRWPMFARIGWIAALAGLAESAWRCIHAICGRSCVFRRRRIRTAGGSLLNSCRGDSFTKKVSGCIIARRASCGRACGSI